MRVLHVHKVNDLHRFSCSGCDSLLEVRKDELTPQHDPRDGDAYTFVCCVCQKKNWVDARLVVRNK